MSGFKIAGIILGAFPITLELLEKYQEVAKRVGLWRHIGKHHNHCKTKLAVQKLQYGHHLKKLLLPIESMDEHAIKQLMENPTGDCWKKGTIADQLENRLGASYDPYISLMEMFEKSLSKITEQLALDIDELGQRIDANDQRTPSTRKFRIQARIRAELRWQLFRFRFSQGEDARNSSLSELDSCNEGLAKLLIISEEGEQLTQHRFSARNSSAHAAACRLWLQARDLFQALSTVWDCDCHAQHSTRLLLKHSTGKEHDFNMLFEKVQRAHYDVKELHIITRATQPNSLSSLQDSTRVHEPDHRIAVPRASALRKTNTNTEAGPSKSVLENGDLSCTYPHLLAPRSPSVTLTLKPLPTLSSEISLGCITNLCQFAYGSGGDSCGYLSQGKYLCHLYQRTDVPSNTPKFITLDQILRGTVIPMPRPEQRFALSFILSSSFLQLIESPCLSSSWTKSDVIFSQDPVQPGTFRLDWPYMTLHLAPTGSVNQSEIDRSEEAAILVEMLGVVLAELGFGALLEDQDCRRQFGPGLDRPTMMAFDLAAAKKWGSKLRTEVGGSYADAVYWCLGGSVYTSHGSWRQEMLQSVVCVVEQCCSSFRQE